MHHVNSRATAAPPDRERPINVSQELPAWPPPQAPDHAAAHTAPLRRVLADLPDEYRLEPLGVIEAELRRNRADSAG
jgi:hypothetical protein